MIYAIIYTMIDNPESLKAYREKAGEALQKHGGSLLQATPTATSLEGSLKAPDLAGILSFPSREAALAWHNDPELAAVHGLRRGAGDSSIILL